MATAALSKNLKEALFEWEGKDKNGKVVRGEMRAGGEAVVDVYKRQARYRSGGGRRASGNACGGAS